MQIGSVKKYTKVVEAVSAAQPKIKVGVYTPTSSSINLRKPSTTAIAKVPSKVKGTESKIVAQKIAKKAM